MLRVGITGGIGSGKSTVSKIFEVLGIPVYYADNAARHLMNENEELRKSVKEFFGEESYKDGRLNSSYVASIVFNDKAKLDQLNAIAHPFAIRDANEWMRRQNAPYTIKEAAIMFETGSAASLDFVIGVSAPQSLRIKRTMDRDAITKEQVLDRINRQMDETIKMKLCDAVLMNDEQHPLLQQVLKLHEELLALYSKTISI